MILITGATRFVERKLLLSLADRWPLRIAVRDITALAPMQGVEIDAASLFTEQDWSSALLWCLLLFTMPLGFT